MKEYLNCIRNKGQTVSLHKQALYTLLLALLGIALGAFFQIFGYHGRQYAAISAGLSGHQAQADP